MRCRGLGAGQAELMNSPNLWAGTHGTPAGTAPVDHIILPLAWGNGGRVGSELIKDHVSGSKEAGA